MNLRRQLSILLLVFIFSLASVIPLRFGSAFSQTVGPALTGRIVDNANLLSSEAKLRLTNRLKALEQKTGDQIVVATVKTLNGYDIETYSNELFRRWALGQKGMNNGVLLLVALQDRVVRIEVGYGLEAIVTDATSSVIINTIILSNFREGNFETGIVEGTEAIADLLSGNGADFEARIKAKKALEKEKAKKLKQRELISDIIFLVFFFIFVVMPILAAIFGTKVGPRKYRWLGIVFTLWFLKIRNTSGFGGGRGSGWGGGGFGGGGGSSGGGFSGGGGSSGGGGATGRW